MKRVEAFSGSTGLSDGDHKVLYQAGILAFGATFLLFFPDPTIFRELIRLHPQMRAAAPARAMVADQDHRITDAVKEERTRLLNFIRQRVPDREDAEDILQDVFYELVQAYRTMQTIEKASAWLFRVARNKITDLFRKGRPGLLDDEISSMNDEDESLGWQELLRSDDVGPEDEFLRSVLAEEVDMALSELPREQQQVFVATEIEGRSFKDISEETGVGVNTLLSRKRYAVLHLRRRLQTVYEEFKTRSV